MHSSKAQKTDDFPLDIYALQEEPNAKFRTVQEDGSLAVNVHGVACLLVPAERIMDETHVIATYNLSLLTNNPKSRKAASTARSDKHSALRNIASRMKADCSLEEVVQIEYNGKKYAVLHEQSAGTLLKADTPEEKPEIKPEIVSTFASASETPDSAVNVKIENPAASENNESQQHEEISMTGTEASAEILEIIDVDLKPADLNDKFNKVFLEELKKSPKAWLFKNKNKTSERYFVSYPLIAHELKAREINPVIVSSAEFKARSADFWNQKPNEIHVIYSKSKSNLCAAFITPDFLNILKKSHLGAQLETSEPETPAAVQEEAAAPGGGTTGDQFESAATSEANEPEQQEPQIQSSQDAFTAAAATAAEESDIGKALSVLMQTFSAVGQGQSPKAVSLIIEITNHNGAVDTLTYTRKHLPGGIDNG